MNIAIIDDISTDAEALKNIAVSYFEKKQIRAEICHFFSAEEFFEDYAMYYGFASCSNCSILV